MNVTPVGKGGQGAPQARARRGPARESACGKGAALQRVNSVNWGDIYHCLLPVAQTILGLEKGKRVHELSISQSLLELALQHAEVARARRVTDLHLVIGDLSSVLDDCVQFYWEMISEGTLAAGSRLHFRRVPVQMHCQDCGSNCDLAGACPRCGGARLQVTAGDEFYLDSIDIEQEPVTASGAPA